MNPLEWRDMTGAMYEAANMASGQIRTDKQTEVMIDHAVAVNQIPRAAPEAMAAPSGSMLPTGFQT